MRYSASEKVEIIRIVEQSSLSARKTLAQIGVPRATFYRWYNQYQTGGPEALEDNPSGPSRVWNRIPDALGLRSLNWRSKPPSCNRASWRCASLTSGVTSYLRQRFTAC